MSYAYEDPYADSPEIEARIRGEWGRFFDKVDDVTAPDVQEAADAREELWGDKLEAEGILPEGVAREKVRAMRHAAQLGGVLTEFKKEDEEEFRANRVVRFFRKWRANLNKSD